MQGEEGWSQWRSKNIRSLTSDLETAVLGDRLVPHRGVFPGGRVGHVPYHFVVQMVTKSRTSLRLAGGRVTVMATLSNRSPS